MIEGGEENIDYTINDSRRDRGLGFGSSDNYIEGNKIGASEFELDDNIKYVNKQDDEFEDAPAADLWWEWQNDHERFCEFQYLLPWMYSNDP